MQETENTVDVTEEVTVDTATENTEVLEEVDAPTEPIRELSPEEKIYEDLKVERMGKFTVGMGYDDAKYFRNLLDKAPYKGPQQAYLLVVAKAEMSQVCQGLKEQDAGQRYEVQLSSACIESLGFFMNGYEGKGEQSAMRLFSASMLLRPAMGLINDLDAKLEAAKQNLSKEDNQ
jgi:hypothetical protein